MFTGSPVLQSPQIGFSSQAGTPPGSSFFAEDITASPINMSPTFSASKSTPTAPVSMVNTKAPATNQSMSIDGTMSAFPVFAFLFCLVKCFLVIQPLFLLWWKPNYSCKKLCLQGKFYVIFRYGPVVY
jgi:hypothetical protein